MASWIREIARGLFFQRQVVHAIVMRETRTRFGSNQLGYIWAIVNPLALVATFGVMLYATGRGAPAGMDVVGFLATGLLTFNFFRNVANRGTGAISGNKGLLFYPQVQPLDLIIARSQLEIATLAVVFGVVMGGNAVYNGRLDVDEPLLVVGGLALVAGLGSGVGLMLCAASIISDSVERIAGLIMRPLFWVSGVFFTANDLPPAARDILLYNPILHCVEMVRQGWYPGYTSHYVRPEYPVMWLVAIAFLGLTLERVARRRVEVT